MSSIVLFEDAAYVNLLPLVYTRPVSNLRCGILLLQQKISKRYNNTKLHLFARDYLGDSFSDNSYASVNQTPSDNTLFINGRLVIDKAIPADGPNEIGVKGNILVYARLSKEIASTLSSQDFLNNKVIDKVAGKAEKKEVDAFLAGFQWDLVGANGDQIKADFNLLTGGKGAVKGKIYEGVFMINKDQIYIEEGAKVKPCVTLDAEEGPIYIDKGAKIFPNSVIEGPAYIGENSAIKINGKIYENTTIGPVCKIGGEVEGCIVHGYSNKQHDGFIGHAYIGEWCNLGAGTSNSDLKNNYGNVKVWVNGQMVDSGSMFVGLTMGDHSKSAINTMFNTGTVVGVMSNVFGAGLTTKNIPSYSWGGPDAGNLTAYKVDKGIEVAKKVMARRKLEFTDKHAALYKKLYDLTEKEREIGFKAGKSTD